MPTVDVFTPVVDDPYWFGKVAAAIGKVVEEPKGRI